jgi:hypothetical protein
VGFFIAFLLSRDFYKPFYEEEMDKSASFGLSLYLLRKEVVMSKLENSFQSRLIKELKDEFDGCIVTKMDAGHIQGIPDLLILKDDKWATLECKGSKEAKKQPNQEYYISKMNEMSFARFIYPENKEEVVNELRVYFQRT